MKTWIHGCGYMQDVCGCLHHPHSNKWVQICPIWRPDRQLIYDADSVILSVIGGLVSVVSDRAMVEGHTSANPDTRCCLDTWLFHAVTEYTNWQPDPLRRKYGFHYEILDSFLTIDDLAYVENRLIEWHGGMTHYVFNHVVNRYKMFLGFNAHPDILHLSSAWYKWSYLCGLPTKQGSGNMLSSSLCGRYLNLLM